MAKAKKHKKSLFSKVIIILFILIMLVLGYTSYTYYNKIFKPNININVNDEYIYIPTGSTFEDVLEILKKEQLLLDIASFEWLAEIKKLQKQH